MKDLPVSIIIPVYNTQERLLSQCLNSVSEQTYENIEIIIINDGSDNPKTLKIIKDFSSKNNFLVLNRENNGVSAARNAGLEKSRGNYIFFLDSDDYIDSNLIAQLVKIAKTTDSKIVYPGMTYVDENKCRREPYTRKGTIAFKKSPEEIYENSMTFVANGALVESKLAKSNSFNPDLTYGEDLYYMLPLLKKEPAYFAGLYGYYYVRNSSSVTRKNDLNSVLVFFGDMSTLYDPKTDPDNELILEKMVSKKAVVALKKYSSSREFNRAGLMLLYNAIRHETESYIKDHIILENSLDNFILRLIGRGRKKLLYIILKANNFKKRMR